MRRVGGTAPSHAGSCGWTAASWRQIAACNTSEVRDPRATLVYLGFEEDLWGPAWDGTSPRLFAEPLLLIACSSSLANPTEPIKPILGSHSRVRFSTFRFWHQDKCP